MRSRRKAAVILGIILIAVLVGGVAWEAMCIIEQDHTPR